MKWGRKKPTSSSGTSLFNKVFAQSWLSKFKPKGASFEQSSGNMKTKTRKFDFLSPSSSVRGGRKPDGFYSLDCDDDGAGDSYWRLSFGEERRNSGRMNPVWCDHEDDDNGIPILCSNSGSYEMMRAMEMGRAENVRIRAEIDSRGSRGENREVKIMTPRRRTAYSPKVRNLNHKTNEKQEIRKKLEEEEEMGSSNSVEKDIFEIESLKGTVQAKDKDIQNIRGSTSMKQLLNSELGLIDEDFGFGTLNLEETNPNSTEDIGSEKKCLGDRKIKRIKVKSEPERKSVYINRQSRRGKTKQSARLKAYSPRTECKIRALEDLKKARMMKTRKKAKAEEIAVFDSFAVVKSSFNPEKDFRDSMVEMIIQKGIRQPKELEELLACYLTLNCDEYHDIIIKAFRQVWYEMNQQLCFDGKVQQNCCFDE